MRLYFPVDLTGDLIMIEKLVLGEIWTGDLPISNPDALTSAPSRQFTVQYLDVSIMLLNSFREATCIICCKYTNIKIK